MHQCMKFILFWNDTLQVLGRSFRPSSGQDCTNSNKHLSNRYCCLLASGYQMELYVHRAVHHNIISKAKPTRCTNVSNLFYFGMTLYMFRTVFPSIIRSSRLYKRQQAFVKQILLAKFDTMVHLVGFTIELTSIPSSRPWRWGWYTVLEDQWETNLHCAATAKTSTILWQKLKYYIF